MTALSTAENCLYVNSSSKAKATRLHNLLSAVILLLASSIRARANEMRRSLTSLRCRAPRQNAYTGCKNVKKLTIYSIIRILNILMQMLLLQLLPE